MLGLACGGGDARQHRSLPHVGCSVNFLRFGGKAVEDLRLHQFPGMHACCAGKPGCLAALCPTMQLLLLESDAQPYLLRKSGPSPRLSGLTFGA